MTLLDQYQNVPPSSSSDSQTVSPLIPSSSEGGSSQVAAGADSIRVNKKGFIEVEGQVQELLPSATFKIVLENGHEILAHLSGRMRMHKILILPGDRVRIEMTPYDMTKGRIVYRY